MCVKRSLRLVPIRGFGKVIGFGQKHTTPKPGCEVCRIGQSKCFTGTEQEARRFQISYPLPVQARVTSDGRVSAPFGASEM